MPKPARKQQNERAKAVAQKMPSVRMGTITDTSPLSVVLGGSDPENAYVDVKALGTDLSVDDVVPCLLFGHSVLILAGAGSGGGSDPTKEDVANKSDDETFAADSTTLYPTQHAVKAAFDALSGGVDEDRLVRIACVTGATENVPLTDVTVGSSISGVTLALHDRVFLPVQSSGVKGVYVVVDPVDPAENSDDDNYTGCEVWVEEGTSGMGESLWAYNSANDRWDIISGDKSLKVVGDDDDNSPLVVLPRDHDNSGVIGIEFANVDTDTLGYDGDGNLSVLGLADKANATDVAAALYLKADEASVEGAFAEKEDLANKSDDETFADNSTTEYPTQRAVKAALNALPGGTAAPTLVVAAIKDNQDLSSVVNGGNIDGVTLATGNLVLLAGQSDDANDVYLVNASDPATPGTISRSGDPGGILVSVSGGDTYGGTLWMRGPDEEWKALQFVPPPEEDFQAATLEGVWTAYSDGVIYRKDNDGLVHVEVNGVQPSTLSGIDPLIAALPDGYRPSLIAAPSSCYPLVDIGVALGAVPDASLEIDGDGSIKVYGNLPTSTDTIYFSQGITFRAAT